VDGRRSPVVSSIVEADAGDLVESDLTFQVDVDRDLFIKVPLESASSTLSSLVTLSTPGVAADSNGLFHGLGDHASNSFSVDGQSITDQQMQELLQPAPYTHLPASAYRLSGVVGVHFKICSTFCR
jgi:hypothetical protein